MMVGAWRSLVARWHGGPEVARSNRVAPTITVLTFVFLLLTSVGFSAETGWIRSKGFFKPFVKLPDSSYVVLFVSPELKVYRGRCKKQEENCIALPKKKFPSRFRDIVYIILKPSPPLRLEVIEAGKVSNSVVEKR